MGRIASRTAAVGGGWPMREYSVGFHRIASRPFMISQTCVQYSFQTCRRYIGSLARPPIRNVIASHTMPNMSPGPGVGLPGLPEAGKVAPCMQLQVGRYSKLSHKANTQSQDDIPIPDTLKEHEYATFKEWSNNCIEFCLPGCLEQIHHLTAGEKSMSQVSAEQHKLIESIANNYKQYGLHLPPGEATFCPFTAQGVQEGFGDVDMQPVDSRPCPEGIQDLDCQSLQQYLDMCKYYRFTDCEGQLEKLHNGKKSITELLEDRNKLLQDVVRYYDANIMSKASDDSASSTHEHGREGATELSQMQRFKQMVKEYGTVVVIFHVCISLISLGICYTLVSSGVDLVSLITKLNLLPEDFNNKIVAGASTFVIAYAFHKMFVPVRMGITLASAPLIVRYLRRIGFLKAPKTK